VIRLGSGDGPLSVRGYPSTVKGTRRSFLTASQKPSSGPALERRSLCTPSGQRPRARREPARTGRGPSPAQCRQSRVRQLPGATADGVPVACPISRSTPGNYGHSRTTRYAGSPADRQADPLRKQTFQAGTRPPRCMMISTESSESRPSRFAVALRAMTRRPRPRGWQLREGRGSEGISEQLGVRPACDTG
jgi:hypothetical protein